MIGFPSARLISFSWFDICFAFSRKKQKQNGESYSHKHEEGKDQYLPLQWDTFLFLLSLCLHSPMSQLACKQNIPLEYSLSFESKRVCPYVCGPTLKLGTWKFYMETLAHENLNLHVIFYSKIQMMHIPVLS